MNSGASASGPTSGRGAVAARRSGRDRPSAVRQGRIALAVLGLLSAAMLLFALVSQYGFGLAPCTLCHWQRWAHIAVIALAAAGLLAGGAGGRAAGPLQGIALAAIALAFLAGAAIAGFHVGVELHWWEGTSTCGSGATPDSVDALKAQLMAQPLVRCDEVAFAVAGISMAGWNGIGSLLLALAAAFAARRSLIARAPGG